MAGGFDALGLMPELIRGVSDLSWLMPTDVQDEAIPLILGGGDVMVAAETGSGKTAAFCLPMIQCVYESRRDEERLLASQSAEGEGSALDRGPPDIRISTSDKDGILTVSEDGLSCESNASKMWAGARATHGVLVPSPASEGSSVGQFYFECEVVREGICRVGWSTVAGHLELGRDMHGFGFGGTGMASNGNKFTPYGEKYGRGDVVGCLIDTAGKAIRFHKNGMDLGKAFDLPESFQGSVLFPAIVLKDAAAMLNFGATPFKFSPDSASASSATGLAQGSPSVVIPATSRTVFAPVSRSGPRRPLAIIIEPARDLAEQVYQNILEFTRYVSSPELSAVLLIGGESSKRQQEALTSGGGVDIIVGTFGKIKDMFENGSIDLSQIRFFILDEADQVLSTEGIEEIMKIFTACPTGGAGTHRLQVCFFSATLHSPQITELANRICVNATWVDLKGENAVPESVHHVVYKIDLDRDYRRITAQASTPAITDGMHPQTDLSSIPASISTMSPESQSQMIKEVKYQVLLSVIDRFAMMQCMIFCRTNLDCDNLETFLCNHGGGSSGQKFYGKRESGKENPYSCSVLAGMRSMEQRRASLEAFKDGYVRFLICTDVAARGIDVAGLPYMINFTLPDEPESYIHRVGRIGRADRMGLAISIVAGNGVNEKVWYHKCGNRGKGCTDKRLVENGGCTILYDETALLAAIEERLSAVIPELDCLDFSLPESIASLGINYGEDIKEKVVYTPSVHVDLLGPTIKKLADMEVRSQVLHLQIQSMFQRK